MYGTPTDEYIKLGRYSQILTELLLEIDMLRYTCICKTGRCLVSFQLNLGRGPQGLKSGLYKNRRIEAEEGLIALMPQAPARP